MSQSAQGQATVTETAVDSTTATVKPKGEKLTEKILGCLKSLPQGKFATIAQVQAAVHGVTEAELTAKTTAQQRNVIQSTVSQMVAKGKVHKEKTGGRMPGYCMPVAKATTTPTT
jgi:hypothetical protein